MVLVYLCYLIRIVMKIFIMQKFQLLQNSLKINFDFELFSVCFNNCNTNLPVSIKSLFILYDFLNIFLVKLSLVFSIHFYCIYFRLNFKRTSPQMLCSLFSISIFVRNKSPHSLLIISLRTLTFSTKLILFCTVL